MNRLALDLRRIRALRLVQTHTSGTMAFALVMVAGLLGATVGVLLGGTL